MSKQASAHRPHGSPSNRIGRYPHGLRRQVSRDPSLFDGASGVAVKITGDESCSRRSDYRRGGSLANWKARDTGKERRVPPSASIVRAVEEISQHGDARLVFQLGKIGSPSTWRDDPIASPHRVICPCKDFCSVMLRLKGSEPTDLPGTRVRKKRLVKSETRTRSCFLDDPCSVIHEVTPSADPPTAVFPLVAINPPGQSTAPMVGSPPRQTALGGALLSPPCVVN